MHGTNPSTSVKRGPRTLRYKSGTADPDGQVRCEERAILEANAPRHERYSGGGWEQKALSPILQVPPLQIPNDEHEVEGNDTTI